MELIIAAVLFVALATALFGFGAAALAPASPMGSRLRTLLGTPKLSVGPSIGDRIEQVLAPLSKAANRRPNDVASATLFLIRAGYREPRHLTFYLGLRLLMAATLLVVALLSGSVTNHVWMLVAAPAVGYMLPAYLLRRKVRTRQTEIRIGLADALDLSVICVEAGLGLDQALQRIAIELDHAHPQLAREFELVHLEMRAGVPRADALRNLAFRTGVDDVRALTAVLIQTDRFGTSIAQALRVHSDSLRTERRQRAEEAAAKTTIKMIPALVFFVFPAMFVVTMGPIIISLARGLLPVISK